MKQKTFESILRRLQDLMPDQAGPLMRSVQDLTAQNAALGAVDQKARVASRPNCSADETQKWGRTRHLRSALALSNRIGERICHSWYLAGQRHAKY